ncbi:hypothetical protein ACFDTO_16435 [Microbacteriaceae bacterium 4G12]
MKKAWSVLGVIVAMLVSTFLLTKLFLYYADRPLKINTISKVEKVKETEEVLQFIHTTHESFNSFLNYGKSESYTEGDWKALHKWFTENEKALQNISNQVNSPKLKLDVASSYELAKLGVQAGNIQYVVYAHRIYHDLDIIINGYREETNVWGYTEISNGKHRNAVKEALKANNVKLP